MNKSEPLKEKGVVMISKVVARQYGNSVEFLVETETTKEALQKALEVSKDIFNYEGFGDEPTVTIKVLK